MFRLCECINLIKTHTMRVIRVHKIRIYDLATLPGCLLLIYELGQKFQVPSLHDRISLSSF